SERGFGRIPVVDPEYPGRLVGLLRRQDIVRAYRHAVLRKMENQYQRENLRLGRLTETEVLQLSLVAGMAAVGQRIKDLNLPSQALITSIRRNGQTIIAHGETLFQPGDEVVLLTRQGTAETVRQVMVGES
ncbi:MAG TPA: TrkA C-terminal domain-containing protein, partial [Anaerolineae bacterium]|nr:TrkA C-terminal domain-containing protein [Anaerolineae bacterium]